MGTARSHYFPPLGQQKEFFNEFPAWVDYGLLLFMGIAGLVSVGGFCYFKCCSKKNRRRLTPIRPPPISTSPTSSSASSSATTSTPPTPSTPNTIRKRSPRTPTFQKGNERKSKSRSRRARKKHKNNVKTVSLSSLGDSILDKSEPVNTPLPPTPEENCKGLDEIRPSISVPSPTITKKGVSKDLSCGPLGSSKENSHSLTIDCRSPSLSSLSDVSLPSPSPSLSPSPSGSVFSMSNNSPSSSEASPISTNSESSSCTSPKLPSSSAPSRQESLCSSTASSATPPSSQQHRLLSPVSVSCPLTVGGASSSTRAHETSNVLSSYPTPSCSTTSCSTTSCSPPSPHQTSRNSRKRKKKKKHVNPTLPQSTSNPGAQQGQIQGEQQSISQGTFTVKRDEKNSSSFDNLDVLTKNSKSCGPQPSPLLVPTEREDQREEEQEEKPNPKKRRLTYDEVEKLRRVLGEVYRIVPTQRPTYPQSYPILQVFPVTVYSFIKQSLISHDIAVRDVRINGSAASYIVGKQDSANVYYNDIDFVFNVGVDSEKGPATPRELFDKIREIVRDCLHVWMPHYLEPILLERNALESAYIEKMFLVPFNRDQDHRKIGNPTFEEVKEKRQDFWSLMSLKNPEHRNIELKFVYNIKRAYEFSTDSFQVILPKGLENSDLIITRTNYPEIYVETVFRSFDDALHHLDHKQILVDTPEEIRGGGLFKYCKLLLRGFTPIGTEEKVRKAEGDMLKSYFRDYPTSEKQFGSICTYLQSHFATGAVVSSNAIGTVRELGDKNGEDIERHSCPLLAGLFWIETLLYVIRQREGSSLQVTKLLQTIREFQQLQQQPLYGDSTYLYGKLTTPNRIQNYKIPRIGEIQD